jgi:ribosomal-protein-alanine N-acetyltransferase
LGIGQLDAVLALENLLFSSPWSKEQYTDLLRAGLCSLWGLMRGEELAAYAAVSASMAAAELELYNIAVHPSRRRLGLGSSLLGVILEEARRQGFTRVVLEVRAGNVPAIGLYRSLGFTPCGLRRNYYTKPDEDAVIYECVFRASEKCSKFKTGGKKDLC